MQTPEIDQTLRVDDALRLYPAAAGRVFNAFGIDTCCGGGRTLRAAAAEDDVGYDALIEALAVVIASHEARA